MQSFNSPICLCALTFMVGFTTSVWADDAPKKKTCLPDDLPIAASQLMRIESFPPFTLAISDCAVKDSDTLVCNFILTNHKEQGADYTADPGFWRSTLVDNLKISHPQSKEYFLDGRCGHHNKITLAKDDAVVFIQEFTGSTDDISKVNILFNLNMWYGQKFSLPASVGTEK